MRLQFTIRRALASRQSLASLSPRSRDPTRTRATLGLHAREQIRPYRNLSALRRALFSILGLGCPSRSKRALESLSPGAPCLSYLMARGCGEPAARFRNSEIPPPPVPLTRGYGDRLNSSARNIGGENERTSRGRGRIGYGQERNGWTGGRGTGRGRLIPRERRRHGKPISRGTPPPRVAVRQRYEASSIVRSLGARLLPVFERVVAGYIGRPLSPLLTTRFNPVAEIDDAREFKFRRRPALRDIALMRGNPRFLSLSLSLSLSCFSFNAILSYRGGLQGIPCHDLTAV
jgi:hypothetical protein